MQFDREKLKAVVLYICSHCEPSQLGAVKLHKTLYYADMVHYLDFARPLTGADYVKRPLGPTCYQLLPTLRELRAAGALDIREVDYFGYRKKEYFPLRAPEMDRLNDEEQMVLDEIIEFVCQANTAKTISDFSHSTPWEIVDFGEYLPYHNALHLIPSEVSEEAFDWAAEQASAIEAERSKKDPVDFPVFSSLRESFLQARRP